MILGSYDMQRPHIIKKTNIIIQLYSKVNVNICEHLVTNYLLVAIMVVARINKLFGT